MNTVGVQALKNRLSAYLRMVRRGEGPVGAGRDAVYPELIRYARTGKARLGAPNRSDLYPRLSSIVRSGSVHRLLDDERDEH